MLCISTWLAFLPSSIWEALKKKISTPERAGVKIYYQKQGGAVQKFVYLLRTFLILPTASLSQFSNPAYDSWLVSDWRGVERSGWIAIVYLVGLSPLFGWSAPILRWKPLMSSGAKFYNFIASGGAVSDWFTAPLEFRPLEVRSSRFLNIVAGILLVLVTFWNIRSFADHRVFVRRPTPFFVTLRRIVNSRTAQKLDWIGRVTRLDQSWSIFAPDPPRDDGWHVVIGKSRDGREMDILHPGEKPNWEKPTIEQRNSLYHGMQWRSYFINLNRAIGRKLYPYYGEYLCRKWNAEHSEQDRLEAIEIDFISERTVPPGEIQTTQKNVQWQQSCSTGAQKHEIERAQVDFPSYIARGEQSP